MVGPHDDETPVLEVKVPGTELTIIRQDPGKALGSGAKVKLGEGDSDKKWVFFFFSS